MERVDLDPLDMPEGLMERVMLHETRSPAYAAYDRDDSLKAMRLMKRVFVDRFNQPALWRAPHAKSIDMITIRSQFGDFADYPDLSDEFMHNVTVMIQIANNVGDARQARYARLVFFLLVGTTFSTPPAGVIAWRTAGATSPGARFTAVITLEHNTFHAVR